MGKYTYTLKTFHCNKWLPIVTASLDYCRGYLDARTDSGPHQAYRLWRHPDNRLITEVPAREDVSVGMVAGWPTAEQYEAAAARALAKAEAIRIFNKRGRRG